MNEFTKEELIRIKAYVSHPVWISSDILKGILLKLQSMIDNYCEHKNKQVYKLVKL